MADDKGQAKIPDSLDFPNWTIEQAVQAITGDSVDLTALIDIDWFQWNTDGLDHTWDFQDGKGKPDAKGEFYYYAFGKQYFGVDINHAGVKAFEDGVDKLVAMGPPIKRGIAGEMNASTMNDLATLVSGLLTFLTDEGTAYRSWAKMLDSNAADFNGKAAAVLQAKTENYADSLEHWAEQISYNYGQPLIEAVNKAATALNTFNNMAAAGLDTLDTLKVRDLAAYMMTQYTNALSKYLDHWGLILANKQRYMLDWLTEEMATAEQRGIAAEIQAWSNYADAMSKQWDDFRSWYIEEVMRRYQVNGQPSDPRDPATWDRWNTGVTAAIQVVLYSIDGFTTNAIEDVYNSYQLLGRAFHALEDQQKSKYNNQFGQNGFGGYNYDPYAGMENYNPYAGMENYNPYAGMENYNPYAGMENYNPYAGIENYDPFAGIENYNPLAGMENYNPYGGAGNQSGSPYAGSPNMDAFGEDPYGANGNMPPSGMPSYGDNPYGGANPYGNFNPGDYGLGNSSPGAGVPGGAFDPGTFGTGPGAPGGANGLGPNGELLGPDGQPVLGPNGELLGPDGQPLLGPNGELLGPDGQPVLGPNGEILGPGGIPRTGPNGELLGPDGQPILGPNGELLGPDGQPILGPQGQLLGPDGQSLLGPQGQLLGPDGSSLLGPNGELLGPDGQPILGPDGQPILGGTPGAGAFDPGSFLPGGSGTGVPGGGSTFGPGSSVLNPGGSVFDPGGSALPGGPAAFDPGQLLAPGGQFVDPSQLTPATFTPPSSRLDLPLDAYQGGLAGGVPLGASVPVDSNGLATTGLYGGGPGDVGSGTSNVGGVPGSGAAGLTGVAAPGFGGMPFMPPMGGMGGMGQGQKKEERERQTWLSEDEEVWGTSVVVGSAVIGRSDEAEEDFDPDEMVVPVGPVRSPRPGSGPVPARAQAGAESRDAGGEDRREDAATERG